MNKKIQKIREAVEKEFFCHKHICPAHRMDHVLRVYNLCEHLARGEKVDWDILRAAALLHDIGRANEAEDKSGRTDHAVVSTKMAAPILKKLKFSEKKIKRIQQCILSHRYRASRRPEIREAKILFDADKLDSLGAVGVARAFAWAGRHNAHLYRTVDIKEYVKDNLGGKLRGKIKDRTKHSPQIEFETKLKFLVDKLYTKKAKKIGRKRMKYFKDFLKRMEREIKGEF